jgi:hypothetical protein
MYICVRHEKTVLHFFNNSKGVNMINITTTNAKALNSLIKPLDYVTNGVDIGRYFGTTKRGVYVVAWGDKRDDQGTAKKLTEYVAKHSV